MMMKKICSLFIVSSYRLARLARQRNPHQDRGGGSKLSRALHQVNQGKAQEGDGYLDHILAFDQDPNGHGSIESKGDENHTINPGRKGVAH